MTPIPYRLDKGSQRFLQSPRADGLVIRYVHLVETRGVEPRAHPPLKAFKPNPPQTPCQKSNFTVQ